MVAMAFEVLAGVPSTVIGSDTLSFSLTNIGSDYPGDEYGVAFHIAPKSGGDEVVVDGVYVGGEWQFSLGAGDLSAMVGVAVWAVRVTKTENGAVATVDSGSLEVLSGSLGGDVRDHSEKMLDAIEAVLEGRVDRDVESYSIGGRSITKIPFATLRRERSRLIREIRSSNGGGGVQYKKAFI